MTSKRGKGAFYIFIVLTFVIICQLPNILVNSVAFSLNTETRGAATTIVAWTPFGAAFNYRSTRLPGTGGAVARIAILAVTWIVCFPSARCLRHERLTIGANSPSGPPRHRRIRMDARFKIIRRVSARLITYLKRDPAKP